jgi:hypothetical protein
VGFDHKKTVQNLKFYQKWSDAKPKEITPVAEEILVPNIHKESFILFWSLEQGAFLHLWERQPFPANHRFPGDPHQRMESIF